VDINNMKDLEAIAGELDQRAADSDSTYVGVAVVAVNGPGAEFADGIKICRARLGTTPS
jgi:hypothetical protein